MCFLFRYPSFDSFWSNCCWKYEPIQTVNMIIMIICTSAVSDQGAHFHRRPWTMWGTLSSHRHAGTLLIRILAEVTHKKYCIYGVSVCCMKHDQTMTKSSSFANLDTHMVFSATFIGTFSINHDLRNSLFPPPQQAAQDRDRQVSSPLLPLPPTDVPLKFFQLSGKGKSTNFVSTHVSCI